jgi:hypothetical protein
VLKLDQKNGEIEIVWVALVILHDEWAGLSPPDAGAGGGGGGQDSLVFW